MVPGAEEGKNVGSFRVLAGTSMSPPMKLRGERRVVTWEENGESQSCEVFVPSEDDLLAQIASKVWKQGFTGKGVTVAVIATGIDPDHPDLKGRIVGWNDLVNGRSEPYDDVGQGTHVAAIIAQAAPDADIIDVMKELGRDGGAASAADIIACIQWAVEHKDEYGLKVPILSLHTPPNEGIADPVALAIEKATQAGIQVVVASKGNQGSTTIGSPAIAPHMFTISPTAET